MRTSEEQTCIIHMVQKHHEFISKFTHSSLKRFIDAYQAMNQADIDDCAQCVVQHILECTAVYDATKASEITFIGLLVRAGVSRFVQKYRKVNYNNAKLGWQVEDDLWDTAKLLSSKETYYENHASIVRFFDNLRDACSKRDKAVLDMLLNGARYRDVADHYGISTTRVGQIKNRIKVKAWQTLKALHMDTQELVRTSKQTEGHHLRVKNTGSRIITKLA